MEWGSFAVADEGPDGEAGPVFFGVSPAAFLPTT
jgi:hypothetical protein